ncbi:MAG TPA: hypothetical protein VH307_26860 [Streptosporangiaceae bacterium]|nr:hypothetical protein [Streptosporangiaceae bacterium]
MPSREWVSWLVSWPEIFCWVPEDAALADAAGGPDRGVAGEAEHVVLPAAAELQQVAARVLGGAVLRPWGRGDVR